MRRRLFTFASAVSLALFLVTLAMLVMTQQRDWMRQWRTPSRSYLVMSGQGDLTFTTSPLGPVSLAVQIRQRMFAGCTLMTDRDRRGTGVTVVVPHVYAVAAFAVLPLIWIARMWRREQRRARGKAGFCVHCGYDLRASADRCPECATPFQPQ